MRYLLALLLFVSCTVHADDWTDRQKAELATFEVLNLADFGTTHYCLERIPGCQEANPLLGPRPTYTRLALFTAAVGLGWYYLADRNPDSRETILWIGIIGKGLAVGNNIGVSGGFKLSFD